MTFINCLKFDSLQDLKDFESSILEDCPFSEIYLDKIEDSDIMKNLIVFLK